MKPRHSLHRRTFLKGGAASLVSFGLAGSGPLFLQRAAWASADGGSARRPVLVTIFQRGAMDGLAAVPPLASELRGPLDSLRPTLRLDGSRASGDGVFDLGVGFGLHPAFGGLQSAWRQGQLGILHAVGSPDSTRSHFDAQDYMETGTPGVKSTRSGWLNRVMGELGHEAPSPLQGVALTDSLPRSLSGDHPSVAFASLEEFHLGATPTIGPRGGSAGRRTERRRGVSRRRNASVDARAQAGFEHLYAESVEADLRDAGAETFEAMELVRSVVRRPQPTAPGVRYPQTPLGSALREIAQLIKGDVGLEIAFAESGGWDTHVRQGTDQGSFARRASDLGDSIAAFWRDLGNHRDHVVVMTMTEFGRTVAENGSAGTDHGRASCMFVLGDRIDGGRVHGPWPGLEREQLDEGRDLAVATDFRAAFAGVAAPHLGLGEGSSVFPGWPGSPMSLFRS